MLVEFQVENFKNFQENFALDLKEQINNVKNPVLLYGHNTSGKTNLGYAMLDITLHLTDHPYHRKAYANYLNMNRNMCHANFQYVFHFDGIKMKYSYKKLSPTELLEESLYMNEKKVIYYHHITNEAYCRLKGAENLNTNLNNNRLSFLKYIDANTVLKDTKENKAFRDFMEFVENMLLCSPDHFLNDQEMMQESIIKLNLLKELELFLNDFGIQSHLIPKRMNDMMQIYMEFKNNTVSLFSIASTGTKALCMLFYWLKQMENASFVYIDDFDVFYQNEWTFKVAKQIINKTKTTQVLLTSHNVNSSLSIMQREM